jgi:hypothetical protein
VFQKSHKINNRYVEIIFMALFKRILHESKKREDGSRFIDGEGEIKQRS